MNAWKENEGLGRFEDWQTTKGDWWDYLFGRFGDLWEISGS
jgi:hypothetical protein